MPRRERRESQFSLLDGTGAQPEDPLAASLRELLARAEQFSAGDEYREMLRFMRGFPELSPFNAFLIRTQHPGATYVTTAARWGKDFAREVRPDARTLIVLVPFGPVDFVYDLADTAGPPMPEWVTDPYRTRGHLQPRIWRNTLLHCRRLAIPMDYERLGGLHAGTAISYSYPDRTRPVVLAFGIELNVALGPEAQFATLVHELAHIFCGHLGFRPKDPWPDRSRLPEHVKELEAESVSYLVCDTLGIETNAMAYMAHYFNAHPGRPEVNFHLVLTTANRIRAMGDRPPRPDKRQGPPPDA